MGVITLLLLGGFAQDNLGALMAGQDGAYAVHARDGFAGSVRVLGLKRSPYGGYETFLKPQVGGRRGIFSFSVGYLFSPFLSGGVTGIPITADVSANIPLIENLSVRPRISLLAPAKFYAADPFYTYDLVFTAGGGADIIYDPFSWRIRPVISLGGTGAYTIGNLVDDVAEHTEPLTGSNAFGAAGNAGLVLMYAHQPWSLALEARVSYGGKLIPEVSISFLW